METPARTRYPTDLSDAQWERIKPLIPPPKPGGRLASISRRELVNAIVYLTRNGCTWRALPHDFPCHQTVYHYFRRWSEDGTWQRIHDALVVQVRVAAGREPSPSLLIIDSQRVKTTEKGGLWGVDGGKLVKGRKRHVVIDTQGWLHGLAITEANLNDRAGAKLLVEQLLEHDNPRLARLLTDHGYDGPDLTAWVLAMSGWTVEVVGKREGQRGFEVQPKRWIAERTLGWLNYSQRLSKGCEELPAHSEAMMHLMLRRLD